MKSDKNWSVRGNLGLYETTDLFDVVVGAGTANEARKKVRLIVAERYETTEEKVKITNITLTGLV